MPEENSFYKDVDMSKMICLVHGCRMRHLVVIEIPFIDRKKRTIPNSCEFCSSSHCRCNERYGANQ